MKIRRIALLLTSIFTVALSSCGSSNNPVSSSSQKTSETISYKRASKKLIDKMDGTPTYYSLLGLKVDSKKTKKKLTTQTATKYFNYTNQDENDIGPDRDFTDEATYQLFTIDKTIEELKTTAEDLLNKLPSLNVWNIYESQKARINYIPSLNRFSFELLNDYDNELYYRLFTIRTKEDGKVVFTCKTAITGEIFNEKAIWVNDIRYVEDEYYELNESRYFYELDIEWLRSYANLDFKTKKLRNYSHFFSADQIHNEEKRLHSNYYELIYRDNYAVKISDDGSFDIYNEKLQNSYDGGKILIYDFEGISKISTEEKIKYFVMDLNLGFETPEGSIPLIIETTSGKTLTTNQTNAEALPYKSYISTNFVYYDNDVKETVFNIRPYLYGWFDNIRNISKRLEDEYGLKYKYDLDEISSFAEQESERMKRENVKKYYKNLTDARFEKIVPNTIKESLESGLKEIPTGYDVETVKNTSNGKLVANNNILDFSGINLSIEDADFRLGTNEKTCIDYYIINDNYNYTIGSQTIDYTGKASTFTLNPDFDILKARPTPGDYVVRMSLRNYGDTALAIPCDQIGEIEDEGFKFFRNEDGNLAINIYYAHEIYSIDDDPEPIEPEPVEPVVEPTQRDGRYQLFEVPSDYKAGDIYVWAWNNDGGGNIWLATDYTEASNGTLLVSFESDINIDYVVIASFTTGEEPSWQKTPLIRSADISIDAEGKGYYAPIRY